MLMMMVQEYAASSYLVLDCLVLTTLSLRDYYVIIYVVRVSQRKLISTGVPVYLAVLVAGSLLLNV